MPACLPGQLLTPRPACLLGPLSRELLLHSLVHPPGTISPPVAALCRCRRYNALAPRRTAKYALPRVPPPARPPSPPPSPPPAPSEPDLPPAAWWAVASDASGTVLAAINQGQDAAFSDVGDVFVSRDAATSWSNATSAGRRQWAALSVAGGGGLLLAADAGPGFLYTSGDGFSWTLRATEHGPLKWAATAASSDGQRVAAAAESGAIYTSSDRVSARAGTRALQVE